MGHVTAGDSSFGLVSFRRKDRLKEEKARENERAEENVCVLNLTANCCLT